MEGEGGRGWDVLRQDSARTVGGWQATSFVELSLFQFQSMAAMFGKKEEKNMLYALTYALPYCRGGKEMGGWTGSTSTKTKQGLSNDTHPTLL